MTKIENSILSIITENPGIKAIEIARKLSVDRSLINAILYKHPLKSLCYQDSSYKWYANGFIKKQSEDTIIADKSLADLCKYYLNCLSLEENNGVSTFLTSKYSLDYVELSSFDFNETNESSMQLLKRVASSQNRLALHIGYPIMIYKIHSNKTNQDYFKIAPVFLFSVETDGGTLRRNSIPVINIEVIKKYSSRDINEQIIDLVELETELGLNNPDADIEIDEIAARLQEKRQWQWKEKLDPAFINHSIPLEEITDEGIYNKAVLIVAERSPYTVGLESELSQLMLIDENTYRDTALYKWIHRDIKDNNLIDPADDANIIEVLPLNTEQKQAISHSLIDDLTIVTGPPGTGKSQVVTDLLINIAWQSKNALFASKNNKAVDVVETRVNNIGQRPIMLRIGGSQYAYHLAELVADLLAYTPDQTDKDEFNQYEKSYREEILLYQKLIKKKEETIKFRNLTDYNEQLICDHREKLKSWEGKILFKNIEAFSNTYEKFISDYYSAQKKHHSFLKKIFWFFLKKSKIEEFENITKSLNSFLNEYGLQELPEHFTDFDDEYFDQRCQEIHDCIDLLQNFIDYINLLDDLNTIDSLEYLDKQLFIKKNLLAEIASKLWNKWLITRPLKITADKRVEMNQFVTAMKLAGDVDLTQFPELRKQFSKIQKDMTQYLPCWAVTSLSAKGRIPFQPGIFDLVIIDEASQCDIASILPLLYRAKRAIIIGDPKQLKHISSLSKKQDLELLQKYGVGFQWSYSSNSLYDMSSSLVEPNGIIQLRDHHRSYESIIEFSNREFYDGKLRIATKYDKLRCPKNIEAGIRWINISGNTIRPSEGSAYNNEEVNAILKELKRLIIENNYNGSVGVVTPFRAQADRIREAIEQSPNIKEYLYTNNDFLVDTVHKFQGDERDIMIFSPVISMGTNKGAISFLNSTGNLFNVAITRARAILVVIGDMNYCENCGVSYMEHFVKYFQQCDKKPKIEDNLDTKIFSHNYPPVSNPEQVSDWEKILYSALFEMEIFTTPQYPVDKYKLDLALIRGERKLDIEVDGEMYHKDWNGELCYKDQIRNQRLFEMGWDVKRFWVYQIRDELPWCIEQIRSWIENN